jgi:GTP-binding protein Era
MKDDYVSGYVALIGRPNTGKSTLLNRLVGQKVSITSRRPQTTRHRIIGIKTDVQAQVMYVDTPGLHKTEGGMMSRYLNRAASGSLEGVDCVLLLISSNGWKDEDEQALAHAQRQTVPVILVINKIDKLKDPARLLPLIEQSRAKMQFADIIPVSAQTGAGVTDLETTIRRYLPAHPPHYPPDQLSDRNDRFMAAELVREQIFRLLGKEVPYATAVEIQEFKQEPKLIRIEAVIWVEKDGQKAIVIGKNGERMKEIGRHARLAMQKAFACKVYLGLWVKVREGWSDDARALRSLGYGDDV